MTTQRPFIDFPMTPPGLDPSVNWIPMVLACQLLRRHPSQVRRDRAVLKLMGLVDHTARSGGFTRKTFDALWIFRQLVEQRGRREAIRAISNYLEE